MDMKKATYEEWSPFATTTRCAEGPSHAKRATSLSSTPTLTEDSNDLALNLPLTIPFAFGDQNRIEF